MNLQFIADSTGKTTGVYIPINDWDKLKIRYEGIEQDEILIPEEHKRIVRQRIENSNKNPERLLDWEEIKNSFILD